MINRVVAFGCSFTYGSGLPGCKTGNNTTKISSKPAKQSWPFELGKLLNVEAVNKGVPGSSNIEILYHILNFDFQPNDFVVVMWSLPNRDMHFISGTKKIKPYRQLGVWMSARSGYIAEWLSRVEPVDSIIKSWLYMHHADLYLKSLNLKYIHFPAFPHELSEHRPDFIGPIDNLYTDGISCIDECKNDRHPGPLSQIETAKTIQRILKDNLSK
jgi:hypothetical protein